MPVPGSFIDLYPSGWIGKKCGGIHTGNITGIILFYIYGISFHITPPYKSADAANNTMMVFPT